MTADITPAVDPDEDRERPFTTGRPDIQVKAVLTVAQGWLVQLGRGSFMPLHRRGSETGCIQFARPGFDRERRPEAERADGRFGEGHAAKDLHSASGLAAQCSARRAHYDRI